MITPPRKSGYPSICAGATEKRVPPLEGSSGHVPFINVHDLNVLTAELARLLGVALADTTIPDLKTP